MKVIRIILLILILIGVGLLLTQKFWVPSLVSTILKYEGTPQLLEVSDTVPFVPPDTMQNWNWVFSEVSPQGIQFMYPNPLPTTFVHAEEWPPQVQMMAGEFSCIEGETTASDGLTKNFELRVIGGHVYCVAATAEGAAGSTYTSYEYSTKQGDFVVTVSFTLRTPQCLNYDEPERDICIREQTSFSTDALVERIASSIRMQ